MASRGEAGAEPRQPQRQSNATATRVTLLTLAALAVLFTVTWIQMPTKRNQAVAAPASWFAGGLTSSERKGDCFGGGCVFVEGVRCVTFDPCAHQARSVDKPALERRVKVTFVGAAVVIVLVGLAFGAWPRRADSAG